MIKTTPRINVERLRPFVPLALPFVIVAIAWVSLVQPRHAAAKKATDESRRLEGRAAQLSALAGGVSAPAIDGPAAEIIRSLPQVDPVPDVVERLSRLGMVGFTDPDERNRITALMIETGEQGVTGGDPSGQPRARGGSEPDPRFALFGLPLTYTRVNVSFESTYERLGRFLWDMRGLPTIVEIQEIDTRPVSEDGARVRTSMILFVFRRAGHDPALAVNARGPA